MDIMYKPDLLQWIKNKYISSKKKNVNNSLVGTLKIVNIQIKKK